MGFNCANDMDGLLTGFYLDGIIEFGDDVVLNILKELNKLRLNDFTAKTKEETRAFFLLFSEIERIETKGNYACAEHFPLHGI